LASKLVATVSSGLASKPTATVFSGLASKPVATIFSSLTSKLVATVFPGLVSKSAIIFLVEPQNQGGGGFFGLCLKTDSSSLVILGIKITAMVSWFEHQNQAGFGLSVTPQNRQREVGVGHTSLSNGLLHVKASMTRVFQTGLKTSGGVTAGGARDTITEVALEAS
jgi:hypothetical protein